MMRAGTETGSLINHLMSLGTPAPRVGDGATILGWTDRHPATVIAVSPSGKTVTVREDEAIRIDGNGMSDCQKYEYRPWPDGPTRTFRMTKKGWRAPGGGNGIVFGRREKYHDFSF